jgi:hypothetical protein
MTMTLKQAPFALRLTRRKTGTAAIIYRRLTTDTGEQKLDRLAELDVEAYARGYPLLRNAVVAARPGTLLEAGPYYPLDNDWGVRVGCYGKACEGIETPHRLDRTADLLLKSDPTEAAWWLGLMTRHNGHGKRAVRAFRILAEATE